MKSRFYRISFKRTYPPRCSAPYKMKLMRSPKSWGCKVPLGARLMWWRMAKEIWVISGWLWLLFSKINVKQMSACGSRAANFASLTICQGHYTSCSNADHKHHWLWLQYLSLDCISSNILFKVFRDLKSCFKCSSSSSHVIAFIYERCTGQRLGGLTQHRTGANLACRISSKKNQEPISIMARTSWNWNMCLP